MSTADEIGIRGQYGLMAAFGIAPNTSGFWGGSRTLRLPNGETLWTRCTGLRAAYVPSKPFNLDLGSMAEFIADYAAFVYVMHEGRAVHIAGYVSKERFAREHVITDLGKGNRLCFPTDRMDPIENLIEQTRAYRTIYLAHPVSGDVPGNLARTRRWIRWIYDHFPDVAVVADWILTCEVLDDSNPIHRARGLGMDKAVIALCDEFWMVGGRVSTGMGIEKEAAERSNLRVVDLTFLGEEPPAELPAEVAALCAIRKELPAPTSDTSAAQPDTVQSRDAAQPATVSAFVTTILSNGQTR